jgi:thioredoxin-related protein
LDRETYTDSRVVDLAKKFITLKMNTDTKAGSDLAKKYGVEAIPTLLFMNASGKRLHEFVGFKPPEDFIKDMKTALKQAKK